MTTQIPHLWLAANPHSKRPLTEISFFTSRTPAIIHPSRRLQARSRLRGSVMLLTMVSAPISSNPFLGLLMGWSAAFTQPAAGYKDERRRRLMELHTIGIDLGKTVFHLVGVNVRGEVVVRKKFSRKQLLHFTANLQVELIGMEACGGSHFLGRALREQGHEVRLIPAQYVKPYVKTTNSDYIDAVAIAEAVGRRKMRFIPIK